MNNEKRAAIRESKILIEDALELLEEAYEAEKSYYDSVPARLKTSKNALKSGRALKALRGLITELTLARNHYKEVES